MCLGTLVTFPTTPVRCLPVCMPCSMMSMKGVLGIGALARLVLCPGLSVDICCPILMLLMGSQPYGTGSFQKESGLPLRRLALGWMGAVLICAGMGGGADAVVVFLVLAPSAVVGGTLMGSSIMAGRFVGSSGSEVLPPVCSSVLWDVVLGLDALLVAGSLLADFVLLFGPHHASLEGADDFWVQSGVFVDPSPLIGGQGDMFGYLVVEVAD